MLNQLYGRYQNSGLSQVVHTFRETGIKAGTDQALDRTRGRFIRARHQARSARALGQVRLWTIETDTLSQTRDALANSPSPVQRLTTPIHRVVARRLERQTEVPVTSYDTLNVKKVAAAVAELDLVDLERIARHERTHKNRKTVYRSLDKRRTQILDPVLPQPSAPAPA